MFNLSRYFSTVSFILIVLAAGLLGPLYRQLSVQQMTELAEHRNVAMAQVFENSLGNQLAGLMSVSLGRGVDFLQSSTEAGQLQGPEGEVRLRPQAFRLLEVLVDSAPGILSQDELLDRAWGVEHLSPASVKQAISEIRQALGDDPARAAIIATVPRRGYRFIAPLVPVPVLPAQPQPVPEVMEVIEAIEEPAVPTRFRPATAVALTAPCRRRTGPPGRASR